MILHGEHSVVYGKTALAASVDLRTSLSIKPSQSDKVQNNSKVPMFVFNYALIRFDDNMR